MQIQVKRNEHYNYTTLLVALLYGYGIKVGLKSGVIYNTNCDFSRKYYTIRCACTALQVTVTRSQLLKGKRKVDKTFEPVKVNIHSQATYDRVLSKCIAAAWKEEKVENVS